MVNREIKTFLFNCHDLPRRPGEMREYELTFQHPQAIGIPLLMIPANERIDVDLNLQSVAEGVLVTGTVHGKALGECTRCLAPVSIEIEERFQELYYYEVDHRHQKSASKGDKKKRAEDHLDDLDEDDLLFMEEDSVNLELPVRDALVLNLPANPLCQPDCQGLCPDCGLKVEDLPADHSHPKSDFRWSNLAGWNSPQA